MNDQQEEEPSGVISADDNEDKKEAAEESLLSQDAEKQQLSFPNKSPSKPSQQQALEGAHTTMNEHQHAPSFLHHHQPGAPIGTAPNPNGPVIPPHHLLPYPSVTMDATRQYFEARMRDHAAAYAQMAAGAAWAAAQMAAAAADFAAGNGPPPPPHELMLAAQPQQLQHGPPHSFGDVPAMNPLPPLLYQQPSSNSIMAPPQQPWGVLPSPQSYHAPQEAVGAFPDGNNLKTTITDQATGSTSLHNHRGIPSARGGRLGGPDANDNPEYDNNDDDDDDEDISSSFPHRRKRRPQNFASSSDQDAASIPRKVLVGPQQQPPQQQRGKIRRRLRSDGDSSSSGSSFYYNSRRYNNSNNSGKNCHSSRRTYNQKKKARSDESLLGKTAVAALYEWCSRRSHIMMPVFVLQQQQQQGSNGEEFECTVYLDEQQEKVWGKGRGTNKNAAKQEAAQQALQALCPEVLFDEVTGVVKEVPATATMTSTLSQTQPRINNNKSNSNTNNNRSLEDLAPNLAKQLAIGSSNTTAAAAIGTSTTQTSTQASQSPPRQHHSQLKRSLEPHSGGGTTTTSTSDDDENSYYGGSRGASVLSGLLFRIISIDPRTPNPPSFVYHFDPNNNSLKRKTIPEKSTRGRFTCTAYLEVHLEKEEELQEGETVDDSPRTQKDALDVEAGSESKENDSKLHHSTSVRILSSQGAGSSKREARQIACAHLLALLFPECETLVDVKEAAEARHALYAARRLKKNVNGGRNTEFALALPSDPSLPLALQQALETIFNQSVVACENITEEYEPDNSRSFHLASSSTSALRQHGRKMQLDAMVEKALHNLNERDEEGRCLPEELSDDDVGRTVLRRAEPGDMDWIRKLLLNNQRGGHSPESTKLLSACKKDSPPSRSRSKSLDVEEGQECNENLGDFFARLWSPSSIALLLCRAIAAYEDPPLGCAILTVDFCLERGRLLRIASLATESHLPQERFLECLQDFAGCMQCELEPQTKADGTPAAPSFRLTRSDNRRIIRSYLNKSESDKKTDCSAASPINVANLTLQSVKEEGSELSDSSAEKRPARPSSKPSKRSRFQ